MLSKRYFHCFIAIPILLVAWTVKAESGGDTCSILEGMQFQSTEPHEVGLGQEGPVFGSGSVKFQNGMFWWNYSDVSSSGLYRCAQGIIQAEEHPNRNISGSFDGEVLVWDGIKYRRKAGAPANTQPDGSVIREPK